MREEGFAKHELQSCHVTELRTDMTGKRPCTQAMFAQVVEIHPRYLVIDPACLDYSSACSEWELSVLINRDISYN